MKNNTCKKCAFYDVLYRKGYFRFWIEKQGLCCNSQRVVGEKGGCQLYQPLSGDIKIIIALLDNTIENVIELKKIYGVE